MRRFILSLWFLDMLLLSACSSLPTDVSASVSPELRQQVQAQAALMVAAFNERYGAELSVPPIRYYNDTSEYAACSFTVEDTAPATVPASIPLTTNGKVGGAMHVHKPFDGKLKVSNGIIYINVAHLYDCGVGAYFEAGHTGGFAGNTLPHELGHYACDNYFQTSCFHNARWRSFALFFGVPRTDFYMCTYFRKDECTAYDDESVQRWDGSLSAFSNYDYFFKDGQRVSHRPPNASTEAIAYVH